MRRIEPTTIVRTDWLPELGKRYKENRPTQALVSVPKEYQEKLQDVLTELSFSDKLNAVWLIIKKVPLFLKLIIVLYNLREGIIMKQDIKTTIAGIIKALIIVLGIFGVNVNPAHADIIITSIAAIWAAIEVIQGYFTKDKSKE